MADASLALVVEDAAKRLVSFAHQADGSIISTSSLYPSGAPVRVRVSFDGARCQVSDMGFGYHEAELLGATSRQFLRHARVVTEQFGVGFDNHSFFILEVAMDRLLGAVKIVAAASQKAAVLAEAGMVEQAERNDREFLMDKLFSVFGKKHVDEDVEIVGKSGHAWQVVGRVRDHRNIVFDCATASHISVFSAHTKFHDIRLLDDGPKGVVTVPNLASLKGDYLNLLEQSAKVIELDSSDAEYRDLAA